MRHSPAVALLAAAMAAGCNDSTSPGGARSVSLSFASGTTGASASIAPGLNADIVVGSGTNAVTINRVQLVLREIELKKASDEACADGTSDDECEEVSLGPVLVDLPLDGSVTSPFSVSIPEGTYREIEFELHKPEDNGDARDAAFLATNPTFARTSVRIQGVYNGAPFTLSTDVNEELELEFEPALVVGAEGGNATINVDVARWFRTSTGTILAPTSGNLRAISENIAASFRAFDDDDRNGRRDD